MELWEKRGSDGGWGWIRKVLDGRLRSLDLIVRAAGGRPQESPSLEDQVEKSSGKACILAGSLWL